MNHLLALHVSDVHVEGPGGAAALPAAAIRVLSGEEDWLTTGIKHFILISHLETSKVLQELNFLFDEKLVHHGEILKAGRTARRSLAVVLGSINYTMRLLSYWWDCS